MNALLAKQNIIWEKIKIVYLRVQLDFFKSLKSVKSGAKLKKIESLMVN